MKRSCGTAGADLLNWNLLRTLCISVCHERAEPVLIFSRGGERADHRMLLRGITQRRAVDLPKPE
jgi:hypothetical protein